METTETVERCVVDGYRMDQTCTCGHGHDRHSGGTAVRCMSYVGQPDCECAAFKPEPKWRRGDAAAQIVRQRPGSWIWLCRAKHYLKQHPNGLTTARGGIPTHVDALAALARHHVEAHGTVATREGEA
jgi:hypothetical protein